MNSEFLQILKEMLKLLTEIRDGQRMTHRDIQAPDEVLMDNSDAMRYLKVSDRTLLRWRKDKLIDFECIGNKHYYRKSDLDCFRK